MPAPLTLVSPTPGERPIERRYGAGKARYLEDISNQLDPIFGCPEVMVPQDHLARTVRCMVAQLDFTELDREASSLGRRGFDPRHLIGVLVYASLTGVHHASKMAKSTDTDGAYRLLSGGRAISAEKLCEFRREKGWFFENANEQVVKMALEAELIDPTDLAVDGVRLRAHASTKSIRSLKRSKARLDELQQVDPAELDEAAAAAHEEKVQKHQQAVERCEAEGRTNHSVTNKSAGMMKFPSGAALPGHRVTVTACGIEFRFVISVLIGSEPTDNGLLGPATKATRDVLRRAGLDSSKKLQVAADAGYRAPTDLQFAIEHRDEVDVLIHDPPEPRRGKSKRGGGYFSRDEFHFHDDGTATCPAGREMQPSARGGKQKRTWRGVGCSTCALKAQCTEVEARTVTLDLERDRLHGAMRERMSEPGAQERYRRRIATVEPVFSYIEDAMNFRRVSSALTETVQAEIRLKVLAYNLLRLFFCASVRVAHVAGVWTGNRFRTLAIWPAVT